MEIGRCSADAYFRRRKWLYRRVESLEFVDRKSVRRRLSIDFEIPPHLPSLRTRAQRGGKLVPVSVYPKWPALRDLSLLGPDGRPASLYLRDTNKALDFGLLLRMAELLSGSLPAALKRDLGRVVTYDKGSVELLENTTKQLTDALRAALPPDEEDAARRAEDTIELLAQLSTHSLLWIPVTGRPGSDCIVKFSYLDRYVVTERWWKRLLIACSWRERTYFVWLPHSGLHTRYHLDVAIPHGAELEITSAKTVAFPGVDLRSRPAGSGLSKPDAYSEIVDRQVHIYHPFRGAPSHRLYLQLRLAASREGYVTACTLAAILIAGLMAGAFAGVHAARVHLEATAVLLGAVPVVLGYVVLRPQGHAMERHIVGVRAMVVLAGAMPIVAALVLVLSRQTGGNQPDLSLAKPIWAGLLIVSWFVAAGLIVSWLFAANADEEGRDRRITRAAPIGGRIAAAGLAAGALIEIQPYSHIAQDTLVGYLRDNRAEMLVAAILVNVAAVALYTFIGGAWRLITWPIAGDRERGVARLLVVGSGIAWIWGALATTTVTAWQTLAVTDDSNGPKLASFSHAVDIATNALLFPAGVFLAATTVWLLRRHASRPELDEHDARRVLRSRTGQLSLAVAAVGALSLIVWRALSLLCHAVGPVAADVPWLGFAVWIGVAALCLIEPVSRIKPI